MALLLTFSQARLPRKRRALGGGEPGRWACIAICPRAPDGALPAAREVADRLLLTEGAAVVKERKDPDALQDGTAPADAPAVDSRDESAGAEETEGRHGAEACE